MSRKLKRIFAIMLIAALALSACTGKPEETTTAAAETSEAAAESTQSAETETSAATVETTAEAETSAAETEAPEPEEALIEAPAISAEEFPVTDGSTATLPLSWMLYRLCTGEDQKAAEEAMQFTKTNNAYIRLMEGEADLVIAYEPGPNAKADERYGDIIMEPIGLDALIFICNTANSVESLSTEEIRDIYSGKITNWSEVGGEDGEIIAFQREVNSGSQTLMENLMMKGLPMAPAPVELRPSEMGDLIESVARYANTGNALGYSVYFYAKNMYAKPNLRFMAVDGVMPSNDTIRSGEYAYTNPFYAAVRKDEPKDSKAYELFEWLTTDDGQSLVEAMDYVSVKKGTKSLPDDLSGKTSLLPSGIEGNTHRIALNGRIYDGNAGVVFLDENGQYMGRNDEMRIRDDDEYTLIRGSVFPAAMPLYGEPSVKEDTELWEPGPEGNIKVGLYDIDKEEWAAEPVYDYCLTECHDGEHVTFYIGNWWEYGYYTEDGDYDYYEDPEPETYLYDENGNLVDAIVFNGWEEFYNIRSGCLVNQHIDSEYFSDTGESVYQLGGNARLIDTYLPDGEDSCVLEINGRVIATGTDGYVLPYMSDFRNEDQLPEGWTIVHIYSSGTNKDGDYYYDEVGQFVISADGELKYALRGSDNWSLDLVDEHFLLISNYNSGKYSLIDYAGNEISSWINPEDYEYADWWS